MRTKGQRSVGWLDITTRAALILQETHPLERARIPPPAPPSPPGKTITCARALLAAAVPATLQVDVAPQNLKRYDALKNSPRRVVRWLPHRRPDPRPVGNAVAISQGGGNEFEHVGLQREAVLGLRRRVAECPFAHDGELNLRLEVGFLAWGDEEKRHTPSLTPRATVRPRDVRSGDGVRRAAGFDDGAAVGRCPRASAYP